MFVKEKLIDLLGDLVKINNDRVEEYQHACDATDDTDLKALFQQMMDDSRNFAHRLNDELAAMASSVGTNITTGMLYRTWMDVKTAFSGKDRHAILSSCEFGEDAAQRAYTDALKSDTPMPYYIREIIASQRAVLRDAHDTIKTFRDLAHAHR
ncbi:ferritin-like domain-containing protein [Chitinophaga vietnamensis]|uniref:ferritin-like domain-containing protein n=1 Tax=Chitinophaga vietnamensis TaxID=2593957 RepID=UPI001177901B|nr:PA2169 family four-helix-bundle protein [Chitinophaga vietnamensis]